MNTLTIRARSLRVVHRRSRRGQRLVSGNSDDCGVVGMQQREPFRIHETERVFGIHARGQSLRGIGPGLERIDPEG